MSEAETQRQWCAGQQDADKGVRDNDGDKGV